MKFRATGITKGKARGEAVVTRQPISFWGGLDPETGIIVDRTHELCGKSVAGKILVFPEGKGSTAGSYTIYAAKRRNCAPAGLIVGAAESIIVCGAIISDIPLVDQAEVDPLEFIGNGDDVTVDADTGTIEVD